LAVRDAPGHLKGGQFDLKRITSGWSEKLQGALAKGYDGMRVSGNAFWMEASHWKAFCEYEQEFDRSPAGHKMIVCILEIKFESVTIDMLGRARRVRIGRENTMIVGGAGAKKDIEAPVRQIRQQIDETASHYDREKLQERLAKLVGGVAIIRVGGATEVEVRERRDRVDDNIFTTCPS
jgi:hypothetical protein